MKLINKFRQLDVDVAPNFRKFGKKFGKKFREVHMAHFSAKNGQFALRSERAALDGPVCAAG